MTAAVTSETVTNRVADWKKRLESLFAKIEAIAKNHPSISPVRHPVPQRPEELMTRFDVPAPTLNKLILTGGQGSIQIIPYALWVIGANGRLDVFVNDEASILVDASEPGSSTPDWQLFDSQNRRKGAPFDQHLIEALIERIA